LINSRLEIVAIPEEDTATPVFLELYWSKDESL
jgi:hypothetical protein